MPLSRSEVLFFLSSAMINDMSICKITFRKSELDKIEDLASKGLSVSKIAASLGVSKSTFDRRVSEDENLKIILEKGRAKSLEQVASVAYEMAISGKFPAMTMFWLKCQGNWREKDTEENDTKIPSIKIEYIEAEL